MSLSPGFLEELRTRASLAERHTPLDRVGTMHASDAVVLGCTDWHRQGPDQPLRHATAA